MLSATGKMLRLCRPLTRTPVLSSTASVSVASRRSIISVPNHDNMEYKTMEQVIDNLSRGVIGGPMTFDPQKYNEMRQELTKYLPASQDELPARRMQDSFDTAIIPLGTETDTKLRDRYMTHLGGVRIGRLLEDMDVFAVHLVFKHTLLPNIPSDVTQSPFSIVTALVDRIFVNGAIFPDQDIRISGHVTWIGKQMHHQHGADYG